MDHQPRPNPGGGVDGQRVLVQGWRNIPHSNSSIGRHLDRGTRTETGVFTAEEVGVFVLHYEFINVQNCMDEDSVVVVVTDIPQPTIVTPQLEYCLGSSALLYSDMDGVWSGPGIDGSGAIQQSIPGTYSYQFTTGSGSCLAQDSIDITFLELPYVDLPVDTILCPGSPLEIEVPAEAIDSLNLVNAFAIGCEGIGGAFRCSPLSQNSLVGSPWSWWTTTAAWDTMT